MQCLGDILRLMSDLKIHVVALQDCGLLFQTPEGRSLYGNYVIEQFRFGDGKSDTLAFIIDEGIAYHIIKDIKIQTSKDARAMVLTIPKTVNKQDLHLINTYAPPSHNEQKEYIKKLTQFITKNNLNHNNSVVMGDLNDFVVPELDYWTNKRHSPHRTLGTVLNPLRHLKFYDAFRITHPEQKVYTRFGSYDDDGALNEKRVTTTRLDYILTSFANIQQLECISVLDGYAIGPDHRPVLASVQTTQEIPHISSLFKSMEQSSCSQTTDFLPYQPERKYVAVTDNKDHWNKYTEIATQAFLSNENLTATPQNTFEIELWANEFNKLVDKATEQSVEWDETPLAQSQSVIWQEEQTKTQSTSHNQYTIPDSKLSTPLPKVLYKNKIKHDLFKSLNTLKTTINSTTALLTICCQHKTQKHEQLGLDSLWRRLKSNLHFVREIFLRFEMGTHSDKPCEREQHETKASHRCREVERQLGIYIQKSSKPPLTLPNKNAAPDTLLYDFQCLRNKVQSYQTKLVRKFRDIMNGFYLEEDMKKLADNPYHIFKMLQKRLTNSFQHQLSYIIKMDQQTKTFQTITTPSEIRKEVEEEYKAIFNNTTEFTNEKLHKWMQHLPKIPEQDHAYLSDKFSTEELESASNSADPLSSAGPDNIIFKHVQLLLSNKTVKQHILNFMNAIKELNYVPKVWKDSTTSLIYKNGSDPHSIGGYRPISLCSVMYKLYSSLLNTRCIMMIEKHTLLPNTQNGFRPSKETAYCITALTSLIESAKVSGKPLHTVYIDFAKAFDSVPYWAIEKTMEFMSFPPSFVNNITELFRDIHTQVKTPHGYTNKIKLNSGVRQGDVISPTLFILSLAPLIWEIEQLQLQPLPDSSHTHIFTYADDTALIASNTEDTEKLFNVTSEYAADFGIHINAKKSGYAWMNDAPTQNLSYNNHPILALGDKQCYKYLGIYINFQLDFEQHRKVIKNKYQNTVKAIFSLKKVGIHHRVTLVNAVAAALLMYTMNSLILPQEFLIKLDKWTAKQFKICMKAPNDSSTRFLYTELGLKELVHLNYTLYTNTQVARILNRPDVLPHTTVAQANLNIPTFSHHTEKTGYTNKLLQQGGLIPVALVLHKIGLELIDLNTPEQQQTEPQLTPEKLRSVRQIAKQLKENNITHWHQILCSRTQQVLTLPQLHQKFGIRFHKLNVNSWEKIVKTVTDATGMLLAEYQKATNDTNSNNANLATTPSRMNASMNSPTQYVFTDGSVRSCGTAVSAAFFDENNVHNHVFRTVGPQTIFNAEAQAVEYGLYTLPITTTVVVSDSKSLVSSIKKLKSMIAQNKVLLPESPTLQQVQEFASNIMYKYRKSHRYASVLQSIIVQILLRQVQGFTTTFVHVYSHLLDHIYMPHQKHQMNKQLREKRTQKMKDKYKQQATYFMEGNFRADRLCEELPSTAPHCPVQLNSASLPRFILKNTETSEYASAAVSLFVKTKLNTTRCAKMLEEHPELEITKFSPEVDWDRSVYPLQAKQTKVPDHLVSFQYKLKSNSLLTPARHVERQTTPKGITTIPQSCVVCNHPTEDADLTHIFSHCTVAYEHNTQLWKDIHEKLEDTPLNLPPWISLEPTENSSEESNSDTEEDDTVGLGDTLWQTSLGDLGYIPKIVTNSISKSQSEIIQSLTLSSRYTLWKDYWKKATQILKYQQSMTSPSSSPSSPTGDPPDPSRQQQALVSATLDSGSGKDGACGEQQLKKKQTKLTQFFNN
jgi:exonuclease III